MGASIFLFHFDSTAFTGSLASFRAASGQSWVASEGWMSGRPSVSADTSEGPWAGEDSTFRSPVGSRPRAVGGHCTFPKFSVTAQEPLYRPVERSLCCNEEILTPLILVRPWKNYTIAFSVYLIVLSARDNYLDSEGNLELNRARPLHLAWRLLLGSEPNYYMWAWCQKTEYTQMLIGLRNL